MVPLDSKEETIKLIRNGLDVMDPFDSSNIATVNVYDFIPKETKDMKVDSI